MTPTAPPAARPAPTRQDFVSDQEVRWCPGCGDYSILAQMQKIMPDLGIARENIVFVSGIGCSSRFPYYMNTYGFHTIHGRATAIATGIKCAHPELSVWVMTGDGDGLSIGGNHMLHILRRNVDVKIVLFNNRIYGLTKGQLSPTSELGKITKSTPVGSIEHPINPVSFAIAAEATFVARAIDSETAHMQEVLKRAAAHKGVAFVEILQNCNIFNDGAWDSLKDREVKSDRLVNLQNRKPLVFGKNRDKGIRLNGYKLEVASLGAGVSESDLLVYDETETDSSFAFLLSREGRPDFPVPIGVFRDVVAPTYDELMSRQIAQAQAKKGPGSLEDLIYSGMRWTVKANGTSV
ncbi:MAG: 2-oxoacid:ferredoxin oxidoreductase subunit beta [candidate division Zixibacteria bacterium]|nr:2-oxoacid:ferredoxin oxidoreductase subunit beta [candidate division Zixibacteria bacterium]